MSSSHWPAPHISPSLYIPCIILKYFSTPPDFLSSPLYSLSHAFSRQRHGVTPFVLLCISSQRKYCICSIPTAPDKHLLKTPSVVVLSMKSFWSRPIISPLFLSQLSGLCYGHHVKDTFCFHRWTKRWIWKLNSEKRQTTLSLRLVYL